MKKAVAVFFATLTMSATVALAATHVVPGQFSNIQEAVNNAVDGDTISVRPGIYYENLNLGAKSLTIKSVSGAARTIIDGRKQAPVISMVFLADAATGGYSESAVTIDGFTIQNGVAGPNGSNTEYAGGISYYNVASWKKLVLNLANSLVTNNTGASFGGGIGGRALPLSGTYAWSEMHIDNSTVTNNIGALGGAVYSMLSNTYVVNSNFVNNKATASGGAFYSGFMNDIEINKSYITGNSAAVNGGAVALESIDSYMYLQNSVVDNNSAEASGGAFYAAQSGGTCYFLYLNSNTITRNSAPEGGSITQTGPAMIQGANNIIYGNSTLPLFHTLDNVQLQYSDVEGGALGAGNIDTDPLFVNASARNYQLSANSPAYNTGTGGGTDLYGVTRPSGGATDMGAFEIFVPDSVLPISSATTTGIIGANGFFTSDVTLDIAAQDNIAVKELHYTINGVETVVAGGVASIPLTENGTYTISYFAVDTSDNTEAAQSTIIKIDKTAPTVTSTSPTSGATSISTSASVIITFSENILQGSAYSGISLKRGTSTVSTSKTISGNKLTIKPSSSMSSSTTYTVTIPANAMKDSAGNNSTAYSFTFKTR